VQSLGSHVQKSWVYTRKSERSWESCITHHLTQKFRAFQIFIHFSCAIIGVWFKVITIVKAIQWIPLLKYMLIVNRHSTMKILDSFSLTMVFWAHLITFFWIWYHYQKHINRQLSFGKKYFALVCLPTPSSDWRSITTQRLSQQRMPPSSRNTHLHICQVRDSTPCSVCLASLRCDVLAPISKQGEPVCVSTAFGH